MAYKPIDPKIRNNFLDSCAFDPKYSPEDEAAQKIFKLHEEGEMVLNIAHSTQKEIEHPNTPNWVKRQARLMIFTLETSLTDGERQQKANILDILAGKGNPDKMRKDADHIFEAGKYGGYFITTDERILKKKSELEAECSATIVKPSELLDILTMYENT